MNKIDWGALPLLVASYAMMALFLLVVARLVVALVGAP